MEGAQKREVSEKGEKVGKRGQSLDERAEGFMVQENRGELRSTDAV